MPLLIQDAFLPATLTASPMTDAEFARFCAKHSDLKFEMSAEGDPIVTPPPHTLNAIRQEEIYAQLREWAKADGRGIAGESETSFVLPSGARRSPDASWTLRTEIRNLPEKTVRKGYWHLCPSFAVELRSETDRLPVVRKKMREYIDNGAELAWLIDPESRTVEIYRKDREPETIENALSIAGEGMLAGFVLGLRPVWDPLAA